MRYWELPISYIVPEIGTLKKSNASVRLVTTVYCLVNTIYTDKDHTLF